MRRIVFVVAAFLLLAPIVSGQDSIATVKYERAAVRSGERCIVCGGLLDVTNDFVLPVKGRRVPLDRLHIKDFMKNEEQYFDKLQAKGALFAESFDAKQGTALGGVSWGWFLVGLHVLVALLFAGLSGYVAIGKGLKPIPYFFIALAFSAFGFLYVLTRSAVVPSGSIPRGLVKVPTTSAAISCDICKTPNHPSARRCSKCGAILDPLQESEVVRV